MVIRGTSGTVNLQNGDSGSWSDVGDITLGGNTFDVYHHSALTSDNSLGNVLVKQGLTVTSSGNAAPGGVSDTVEVQGDYQLRLSDFGFTDVNGDALSGVRINSGANLFLNGAALTGGTTVGAAQIIAGQLEWRAPSFVAGTITDAINFNVIDNAGTGRLSDAASTLTLSRSVAASSTLDGGGTRLDAVAFSGTWQAAYNDAIQRGGHLATLEGNAGNATAVAEATAQFGVGYNAWLGTEQSTNGTEPAGGWHWVTGNTSITWGTGEPNNLGAESVGQLNSGTGGSHVNDSTPSATIGGYIIEYENAKFIRTGDATLIDTMTGSAYADVIAGLGGADILSGMAGDDRFMVPDTAFASINGGAGFDVIEYTAAATIVGSTLDSKVSDVEGIHLGAGNQTLAMTLADVQGMSSTTDTLYVSSSGSGDTFVLNDGLGGDAIGTGANQWHNTGAANGVATYQYFDSSNTATKTRVLVDSAITVTENSTPTSATSTVNVAGDYQLRLSDFGFADLDGGSLTAVRINTGSNLFLNGVALVASTTVSAADLVAGRLEWHAPSFTIGTITEAINFNVIDNFDTGTLSASANTLTLSRNIAASSVLDAGGTRFGGVVANSTWQQAYDAAIASGAHLATLESGVGLSTANTVAVPIGVGNNAWVGLEQSTNGTEPAGGWHWITGNTSVTPWAAANPTNSGGSGPVSAATLRSGALVDWGNATVWPGYIVEYENAKFIRTGDATLIDTMTGSAQADVIAGLGGVDVLSGAAGDDRFLVPDTAFGSINGGAGFDVIEYTAAASINGATLDSKVTDVEGLHLGTGNQSLMLKLTDVQGMSSTTDTLYVSSSGSGDSLVLTDGLGSNIIGAGANQWHNVGTANGLTTYRYFDSGNAGTTTQLLVDSTISVSANATPTSTASTVNVAGDYQLRLSDFGFSDQDGGSISAVRINTGANLFLNGVALAAGTIVSAADLVAGRLEWHAPSFTTGTITEAINFNVIDNFGTGTLSSTASTLTLSRNVAATSTLDAGTGTRFDAVATAAFTWQQAYEDAISKGGHLATLEANAGNATVVAEATAQFGGGYNPWIGLEQSTNGTEPGGGWHWVTGNTSVTFGTSNPDNFFGVEHVGNFQATTGGSHVNDTNGAGTLSGYIIEYENAKFIRTGDATLIDTITGSAQADVIAGLGGADVLSGAAGDDRFLVSDTAFGSINGGTGFDVIEYTAAATISGATLDSKVTDVEAVHLGAGNQTLVLTATDVQGLSSTTDTLYVSSSGSGDSLVLTDGLGSNAIGLGGNQWHNLGTANGVTTYRYFDSGNVATQTQVLVDSNIAVSANATPTGATSTVNVAGDYQLRLSDFGFTDLDGGSLTAVRINTGANLFLNGVALGAGATVSAAQIIGGQLEWHAPSFVTGTTAEAINFNVIDNFGTGTLSDTTNTLTLSRNIAPTSTLDVAGGTRFDAVAFSGTWQAAFDDAASKGGHLATFEGATTGNATAIAEANAQFGAYEIWLGLERSAPVTAQNEAWHWSTGNTSVTFAAGEPNAGLGAVNGTLWSPGSATKVADQPSSFALGGYVIEYENTEFVRTGLSNYIDTMTGSAKADVMAGLGGADVYSGMAGDDRFLVPDSKFASINGGAGFDVIEYTAAANISYVGMDKFLTTKVTDVEGIHLGAGNQTLAIGLSDVLNLSSTTDTLYVSSNGSGDTLDIAEVIGSGANQWHNQGASNGVTTYQYYDANNTSTLAKLLVDSTIAVV